MIEDPLITEFHDPRNRLDHWLPILEETNASVPNTKIFELNPNPDRAPEPPSQDIIQWFRDNDYNHAFVRSMYKHAQLNPMAGSHIPRPTIAEIDETVAELIMQHIMMWMPTGGAIALREWLDLDYCTSRRHSHSHPSEIRYFIDDGDVLYSFPSVDELRASVEDCHMTYTYVDDLFEQDIQAPDDQAKDVAEAFNERVDPVSWHLDFVLTAQGEWYAIDMGVNGVYFNEKTNEWANMSGHREGSEHDLAARFGDELPEGGVDGARSFGDAPR